MNNPTSENGAVKPSTDHPDSNTTHRNGNGSAVDFTFNQFGNEFLTAARRVATTRKQPIGAMVEWASGGSFKYGDIGRMTQADVSKLRSATDLLASAMPCKVD